MGAGLKGLRLGIEGSAVGLDVGGAGLQRVKVGSGG